MRFSRNSENVGKYCASGPRTVLEGWQGIRLDLCESDYHNLFRNAVGAPARFLQAHAKAPNHEGY